MRKGMIPIKRIRIEKLFGVYDYDIKIKDGVSIIIGENGIGKTKILNIVYSVLTDNLSELINYDFKEIKVYFSRGEGKFIGIKKSEIYKKIDEYDGFLGEEFSYALNNDFQEIRNFIVSNNIKDINDFKNFRKHIHYDDETARRFARKYPLSVMRKIIDDIYNSFKDSTNQIGRITEGKKILYFPTYRRIEEDILNLGIDIESINGRRKSSRVNLIKFGMSDVKSLFFDKEEEIKNILAQGITTLTGNILNELYNIKDKKDKISEVNIDIDSLEIVLNRVSDVFDSKNTEKIIEICKDGKINKDAHLPLKSVLLAFIEQYEKQKTKEDILRKFVNKCNCYLNNKELFYDETNIKIIIRLNDGSEKNIDLSHLSSGEKQIISIFSRIYLNPNDQFILLFDEPELSLSITWQEKLISDILESGNIYFFMAVTHSPFVINDKLEEYANFISINSGRNE